ncbi:MAG: Hcp family type VI secretion system effector [Chloroflexota bacterium]
MAFDAYVKIDGIEGESTDQQHGGEIEIVSYRFGVSQPSAGARGSGGSASAVRANWQDFSIVKVLDMASPKLLLYCANAKKIPTVTLSLCRATGNKDKYMEYKMSDVIVSSVVPGGDKTGEASLPTETITFNFAKIDVAYTRTDHKTGRATGAVSMSWDVAKNTGG